MLRAKRILKLVYLVQFVRMFVTCNRILIAQNKMLKILLPIIVKYLESIEMFCCNIEGLKLHNIIKIT